MINSLLITLGKILSFTAKQLNLGNGSTWPGHLALKINKHFVRAILNASNTKTIIVAGTNGKTTTTKLIKTILEKQNYSVLHNTSGANLLNGVASAILLHSSLNGKLKANYAVFEVDENALPQILNEISPDYLIILNLFRDQLDRYGEVNSIAAKWKKTINYLPMKTKLILNADDPAVATLDFDFSLDQTGSQPSHYIYYFGCKLKKIKDNESAGSEHAVDSVYCPRCGNRLNFKAVYFSHLGDWECKKCLLKRPKIDSSDSPNYPLSGLYNTYNTNAAVLLAQLEGITDQQITSALLEFKPAFGRQEELTIGTRKVRIFLSKNPTSFNESLRTIKSLHAKTILFVLNDRIPDGKDISWIWDTDVENILTGNESIRVAGDRVYDMALRFKYMNQKSEKLDLKIYNFIDEALKSSLDSLSESEILYIIPNYSAMLEVRKLLTGKKIL